MAEGANTILVTGVAGNLGRRLLLQLKELRSESSQSQGVDFRVLGVDMAPEPGAEMWRYERLDLALESSCDELVRLLRESGARAVAHLAFVIDPLRNGVLDLRRMWQINVAGTARVMEAIAEVNRRGGNISKFIFPSSVSAYGPELPPMVDESHLLEAHTLPYAVHKAQADEVAQARAEDLGDCRTYILRPHIFVGASMENYMVGALRGTPTGKGKLAERMRERGRRLPVLLPAGDQYLRKKFQFLHVDDMARLIVWLLRHGGSGSGLTILNVGGRGEPLPLAECLQLANAKRIRLPGRLLCKQVLRLLWDFGISGVPPAALPYMIGSYTMNCGRLQQMLGRDYEQVIRYTVREALADSFVSRSTPAAAS